MGAEVQGHPTGAQPHEGSRKGSSFRLYGHPGVANLVPVYNRGTTFPPFNKVQDAANRSVQWNEGSHRPS